MKNINTFIKENVKSIGSDIYVAPDIPEKKLNNAIKAFKCEDFYESILAIYDDTLFGSAKEGLVFTGEKMIHHKYGTFIYNDIESVEYIEDITVNDKGKESKDEYIMIKTKDNKEHRLKEGLSSIDKKKFAEFLNKIITEFDSYREENQVKPIENMPDELKIAYLKIIVNMAYSDDQTIDEKELAELFQLMTRLKIDKDGRFQVRSYIFDISQDNIESVETLLEIIKRNSDESHHKNLMISLAKDLINVYFSTKNTMDRQFPFLDKYSDLFGLSDEEIDFVYKAVENDHSILREDIDDKAIERQVKELAAKAAGAGIPIAAIYISGSVIGLSAAGITSGLATLGLGLGMTGGLAVVGLIGVLSYKGVKHLTGASELEKYKRKELMLHEVIKQTQKTISLVIGDINYLVLKLNDLIQKHSAQSEKIKKLVKMIMQCQGAAKTLDQKANSAQGLILRGHCPKVLDNDRLESLTSEPTKKPLYDYIISNYELKQDIVDGKEIQQYVLKKDISTEVLDRMAEIFQKIGYYEIGKTLQSKAASKIKGWLK